MDAWTVSLTILSLIIAFFVKGAWKGVNWAGKIGLILAVLIPLSAARWNYKQVQKEDLIAKINAKFGDIKDLEGAIIPRLCIGASSVAIPIDLYGRFIRTGTGPLFRLYVKNSKLFIDIIIRNEALKPIAVIDGNEWTVYSDDYEYNNDDTGFEIVTKGDRKVYFQVYLKDGVAHVSGIVTNSEGYGLKFQFLNTFNTEVKHGQAWVGEMVIIKPTSDTAKQKSAYSPLDCTIFKYPRGKYLGIRK